ncbi:MAG: cobalamin-binding protein [Proteobacteria bacterium]|nr:cobalamin-binding protein [Pseudomonadota bacterium]MBU4296224.1 cobalamin-binding protein [Pseudomonadota bacterium]MCG2746418.1 cobalamin-binding protein [Desulfobulbaceae bacterium]
MKTILFIQPSAALRCILRASLCSLAALLLTLTLLAAPAAAEVFVDQVGRRVEIPDPPQRLVSLMPSITEIVFALGAGSRIKGVTQYSNEPPAAAQLPKIGSYVHPDLEKIISLRPDLCLAVRDGNPKHIVDRITELGIPVYTIDPRNLAEIMESVMLLGKVLGTEKKARDIVGKIQMKIDAAAERVAHAADRPRVFFQIDASPIISAGSNTFIDRLITQAGGINLAAGPTPYPRYSWEDILRMQPEVVIIASMAGGYTDEQLKAEWRKWPEVPAVRNNRLYVVNADLFDRPTARLADGLELLVNIFYP